MWYTRGEHAEIINYKWLFCQIFREVYNLTWKQNIHSTGRRSLAQSSSPGRTGEDSCNPWDWCYSSQCWCRQTNDLIWCNLNVALGDLCIFFCDSRELTPAAKNSVELLKHMNKRANETDFPIQKGNMETHTHTQQELFLWLCTSCKYVVPWQSYC